MKTTRHLLSVLVALAMSGGALFAAAPANDNFANPATLVGFFPSDFSTIDATVEPGEFGHNRDGTDARNSVWFKYVSTATGYAEVLAQGAEDPIVGVYTGTALNKLIRIAKNDDSFVATDGFHSRTRFWVAKGVTYRLAIDTYAQQNGTVSLNIIADFSTPRLYETTLQTGDVLKGSTKDDYGKLTLVTSTTGQITGRLTTGSKTYSFVGAVGSDRKVRASVVRPGLLPAYLELEFTHNPFGGLFHRLDGNVVVGYTTFAVSARAALTFSKANPCPRKGRYSFAISAVPSAGAGIGTLVISETGACTGTGTLGDGTAFTLAAPLLSTDNTSSDGLFQGTTGRICQHSILYGGKGQITIQHDLDAGFAPVRLNALARWFRPTAPASTFIPGGIEQANVPVFGHLYVAPLPLTRIDPAFAANNGAFRFNGYSIFYPSIVQTGFMSSSNVFSYSPPNGNQLKVTLAPATGFATGTVRFTGATAATTIKMVFINRPDAGIPAKFIGYVASPTSNNVATLAP